MGDGVPMANVSPEGLIHNMQQAVKDGSGMTLWGRDYMPLDVFDRVALLGLLDMALAHSLAGASETVLHVHAHMAVLRGRLYDFHESCRDMREQLGAPPEG